MKTFITEKTRKSLAVLKDNIYNEVVPISRAYYQENVESIYQVREDKWEEIECPYRWQQNYQYGAFKASVVIPREMNGRTVEVIVSTGVVGEWDALNPQFTLYVNGEIKQGLDINHTTFELTDNAVAGETYELVMTGYLGNAEREVSFRLSLASVNLNVRKLYYDIKVPYDVTLILKQEDEDRILIEHHLNEALNRIDFRYPQSVGFFESVNEALDDMDKFYKEVCGRQNPEVYAVGHTHIDVCWLWPLRLTRLKSVCSFATVTELMRRYDKYQFMSSQPQLYEFVKEKNPPLYDKIKQKIKEGKWEAEGAMWLEADCNLSSGEALIRQIMFGKRFFQKEFGVDNKILWLPDVFGYSAALPQILQKCGVPYFMTSKISWNDTNKMPYDTFQWEGIDGTDVLTFFLTTCDYPIPEGVHYTTYVGDGSAAHIKGTWERYQDKRINDKTMTLVGFGDGGGGTTPEMIETDMRLEKGIPGCPKVKFSNGLEFFQALEQNVKDNPYLPKWVGELYLEFHRGTYTTMNKTKKYNRKSEILYQDAEAFSVMANRLDYKEYPQDTINQGWKIILLNQFHDILPGSSIKQVYDESYEQYAAITEKAEHMIAEDLAGIAKKINLPDQSAVVFNNLSYLRNDIAILPEVCGIMDGTARIDTQKTEDGRCIFVASAVPSKGYKAFAMINYQEGSPVAVQDGCKLDTKFYTVTLDKNGNLVQIYDKENEREVLKEGERTALEAYEDMPYAHDNWDIAPYYQEKMWEVEDTVKTAMVENGAVRAVFRVERIYYSSTVTYDLILYKHTRRIDFKFYIDWKEKNIILKFKVPTNILANKAAYEIQYGNCERATHKNTSWDVAKYEVCAHKWADISESSYGVSMLNDCKYGHQIYEGDLRWTLNKSSCYPNPDAGKDQQDFMLALLPHAGGLTQETIREGYFLNSSLRTVAEPAHRGPLPAEYSMVSVDNEAVVIEAVKKAEDEEAVVLRLYESTGGRQKTVLKTDFNYDRVYECNMLETEQVLLGKTKELALEFKPFEIKTLIIK